MFDRDIQLDAYDEPFTLPYCSSPPSQTESASVAIMLVRGTAVSPEDNRKRRASWLDEQPLSVEWSIKQQLQQQQTKSNMIPPGVEPRLQSTKRKPSDLRRRLSSRDLFGGRGLFAEMWPIGIAMAFFGLLPVTFRPFRISFHPLRSTLLYCVSVLLLVSWSGYFMMVARIEIIRTAGATSLQTRFTSAVSFVHAAGAILLPLLWAEASNLQRHQELCGSLMENLGYVRTRSCRCALVLSWVAVAISAVLCPVSASLYLWVVAAEGGHWSQLFIHNHVLLLLFTLCALFSGQFHCVRNFANGLQVAIVQELSLPSPSPQRIAALRRGWLQLRDLTQTLVVMPATTIYMLIYVLFMTTVGSYLCIVCFFEEQVGLSLLMMVLGAHFMVLMLVVCDSVHRAAAAVGTNIRRPLEMHCGCSTGGAAMNEINIFREIVSSSIISVSVAGFWDINRGTMSSLLAAGVSYLIVLIQFRQAENSGNDYRNVSSLERSAEGPTHLL